MQSSEINTDKLRQAAEDARRNAYAPYSSFSVGSALLCEDGEIVTGTNIENASYGATVCAERTAIFKAVSEGKHNFKAIAILGGKSAEEASECIPCALCLQVLSEFCQNDLQVITFNGKKAVSRTLKQLLPYRFNLKSEESLP